MIELTIGQGLAVAAAVPVIVIAWAVLFSVEAARRGPEWALQHLRRASLVTLLGLVATLAAAVIIRPLWIGLGAVYPLAVGWLLVTSRRRQLEFIRREMGFGEIEDELRKAILAKLRTGLVVVGTLALGIGAVLAGVGVRQGWIVAGLAPISLVAILRSNPQRLGASPPPSL